MQGCPLVEGFQVSDGSFETLGFLGCPDTHVDFGLGARGDYIPPGAPMHYAHVHSRAALGIVQALHVEDLVRQLVCSAHTLSRLGACVSCFAFDLQEEAAHPFSGGL
jgi:hypothetical protein